ncbi:hypothetical protein PLESTB_001219100 [Pleodorina starrii]|uniref:Uncharacterized protein n=1 Tax=Pleodorina starrii TaxID=330485 RepID=A0A9W6F5N0_9CHLO|nr:hypothetical protein PLESTM_002059200 [Pleodorina starrii]GLC57387.1 hypothetical protein PLESTB_001219100 [Pleodorina starrii]
MRSLTAASTGPPALPLSLTLYGYDLSRQPAAGTLELLIGAAAPRLTRLELWGCAGWPKRLAALLHGCDHLRHVAVCFQPLLPADGAVGVNSLTEGGLTSSLQPAAAAQQRAAAALASGAVVCFPPLAAAATTAAVVKTIGGLHHLRSLELRGCVLNLARRASSDSIRPAAAVVRPRTGAASKAAAERAAVAAAAPSVQQLASALYQLTRLTRLAIDHLNSATPLLAALAAMRGLRHLELPDAAAPAETDLAAIARAAPRLASLTLGSVGMGSVLDAGGGGFAAAAARSTAEVLPLPPALAVLRVARTRPTLRTMRLLRRTVDARGAASVAVVGAAAVAPLGGGISPPPSRMAAVVPGIEIDMLDVEYDALQGFSRGSDGVQRSTLLPESAEALVAAIRLLLPPPEVVAGQQQLWGGAATAAAADDTDVDDGLSTRAGIPPSLAGSSALPSFAGSVSAAAASSPRCGPRGGPRFPSTFNDSALGGSGIMSSFGQSVSVRGGDGSQADVKDIGGEGDWAPPSFGQTWTRELTIHNAHGSLAPPPLEQQPHPQLREPPGPRLAEAELALASEPPAGGGGTDVVDGADVGCVVVHPFPLVGHAVWISEMRPLGLLSLELYGIGVMAGDLEALAELRTLRRLTLASGELEVDSLPCLAALPHLEYLELARCYPCRSRRHGGSRTASTGAVVSRPSTGTGFARSSVGAAARAGGGFGRASGGICVGSARISLAGSDAAAADGDGGEPGRPTGKRALLELCMTAPRLRHVLVVRCMGMVSRAEAAEGPLGAEWVRQRLLAAGPRCPAAQPAPAPAAGGEPAGLHRVSWLGRASRPVAAHVSEEQLGWPTVRWD